MEIEYILYLFCTKIFIVSVPFFCSSRFSLAVIGFWGFMNVFALRGDISVAIVCMVNHTALDDEHDLPHNLSATLPQDGDDNCRVSFILKYI